MTPQRKQALSWLYNFLKPHKKRIAYLALLSLLTTSLVVIQPYITKLIIDEGILAKDFNILVMLSLTLFSLGIITTALSAYNRIKHTRLSGDILFAVREDVYDHLQRLPMKFHQHQRTGDLISRMDRDVSEIQRFALDTLFSTASAILALVGAVGIMLYLNWQLSLILLILVPIELAYLAYMRPKVEYKNIKMRESGADISSFFAEKIPAIKFIQTASSEQRELKSLSRLNKGYLSRLLSLQITEFWTSAIPNTLVSMSRTAIFLIGGYWVINDQLALGSLIAFTTYIGMAFGPVQSLLGLYLAWQRLTVSLDRVNYIRQQPINGNVQRKESIIKITKADITINDLSFSYGSNLIFDNANLSIASGSKVGICGASGIGKTTLLDLLQLHLQPDTGSILIDKIDITQLAPEQWRQHIAVVPQEPVIFRTSLANNIRYCSPKASDSEVKNAIELAGLSDFTNQLSQGADTLISERGSSISGGERQRIGIARAILQKPLLLILDEPTSATDSKTEDHIMKTVDSMFGGITRIIVSHRAKPLSNVDILITIENKKLECQYD